jgi:hypothetical protein
MNVLYVSGYVKTFHWLSWMYCTFMTNNEMSLHNQRHTVHSWQTMKCLYIPRDIQYSHDKQWNVFTYPETSSTFMTNNEMSLHTERHTVHSWLGMYRHFIVCHDCTLCLWVCKDISLFVMNVLYVCGYVKTFHCLSWMYCMSAWQTMKCLYIPRDIQYIHDKQGNVFTYLERYSTFMTNNEMSLHTQRRQTVHSWQTMKCLHIPRDIQYIHDKQLNAFTYSETFSTVMTNNEMSLHNQRHTVHSWQTMKCLYISTVCLSVSKDISLFVMNVLYVSRYVTTFHCLSRMYCMSLGM